MVENLSLLPGDRDVPRASIQPRNRQPPHHGAIAIKHVSDHEHF